MDLISQLFLVVMVDTDNTQHTTDDDRRTSPRVWHKLPTGELRKSVNIEKLEKGFSEKTIIVFYI